MKQSTCEAEGSESMGGLKDWGAGDTSERRGRGGPASAKRSVDRGSNLAKCCKRQRGIGGAASESGRRTRRSAETLSE